MEYRERRRASCTSKFDTNFSNIIKLNPLFVTIVGYTPNT